MEIYEMKPMKKTWKERLKETGVNIKKKAIGAFEWCKDHPQETVLIVSGVVTGVACVGKTIQKHDQTKQLTDLKDKYIYDRSNGHYFQLRRKPSTQEWIEIDARKASGEQLGVILQDMKLTK